MKPSSPRAAERPPSPGRRSLDPESLSARVAELEARNRRLEAQLAASDRLAELGSADEGRRYQTILDSEPACVKLVARDGSLLSMNPAGLNMIDADCEADVIGLCVYDLVRPEERDRFIALHEGIFEGRSASLEFGMTGLRGTQRHMETFAAPLRGDDGRIVAHLAVTHDITARKREQSELAAYRERLESLVTTRTQELEASRDEARRAERLASLGTLAAGVAHELNNPLGTILLGAELMLQEDDPRAIADAVAGIRRDVERCSHIVKSMLRFGRDEHSEKQILSIDDVVRAARDHSREFIEERRIALDIELRAGNTQIHANSTELGQVLINLIRNAVLASEKGAPVSIRTRRDGDSVLCEVSDQGSGMTPEVVERARDPFFTTRLTEGGTGLGLSVSHGIVSDHEGTLEIDSTVGRGTLIRLRLPVVGRVPDSSAT